MSKKIRMNSTTRRTIINAYRDFATFHLRSADKQKHIDFANTVINGKRQNLNKLFDYVQTQLPVISGLTHETVRNLVRRAVGKGSLTDGTSPEVIGYFNSWKQVKPSNLHTANVAGAIARRSKFEDVQITKPSVAQQVVKKPVVKQPKQISIPSNTAGAIQYALTNTQFTATELLTKKFTIAEFLERIGVKVVV